MSGSQELKEDQSVVQVAPVLCGTNRRKVLTQARVRELFEYREDGQLIRKTRPANNCKIGEAVGYLGYDGYLRTRVDGKNHANHRLVWLWRFGYTPEHGLDHIDRDKLNNRVGNLREISQTCNLRNRGNPRHNTSGVRGVSSYKTKNKWRASISVNKKAHNLGSFEDFIEAVAHRLAAEQCLNWEGCDSCSPAFKFMKEPK